MIKKNLVNIILVLLLLGTVSLIIWRSTTNSERIPRFLLGKPSIGVIVLKDKVAGKLVSAQEVEIKSSVSGIVEKLFVETGDSVRSGTPIAQIKPAPEPEELEDARQQLHTCEIELELKKKDYERKLSLEVKGGVSKSEVDEAKGNMEIQNLEFLAAKKKLRLLLEGYLDKDRKEDNLVLSTANGIVIELPVKEGQSITKRNTYNEGSTIALVANLNKLLFKGELTEYEINKIRTGMPLTLYIGAYDNLACTGRVLRVAPQARTGSEPVKFDFEASVDFPFDSLKVHTGLTVVAEFVTGKTDSVLCVDEKYLHYSGDSIYAVTVDSLGKQNKQLVVPGISDETKTEIKSGLDLTDRLKPVDWQ